ncbi:MAG: hypothetical protein C5B50_04740 [Verrucomicrobia bacterium]|nr:MAG: hypothetical protein C5B50_04740 [Verrucomicrobiota bacterium]
MWHNYWTIFTELIRTPFEHTPLIWGIVPLYFALLLGELTAAKANFRTAIQTGFSFLWAAAQWIYPYFKANGNRAPYLAFNALTPINLFVTLTVLALGTVALWSGIRRRYPKYCSFLGYTRFANYFMITIYPIQAHYLQWTWERVGAIALFAGPVWLVLHFGLMPFRGKT